MSWYLVVPPLLLFTNLMRFGIETTGFCNCKSGYEFQISGRILNELIGFYGYAKPFRKSIFHQSLKIFYWIQVRTLSGLFHSFYYFILYLCINAISPSWTPIILLKHNFTRASMPIISCCETRLSIMTQYLLLLNFLIGLTNRVLLITEKHPIRK